MPRYRYEAVDAAGETLREELDAASPESAVEHLRDQGLLPLSVAEVREGWLRGGLGQPLFSKRQSISQKKLDKETVHLRLEQTPLVSSTALWDLMANRVRVYSSGMKYLSDKAKTAGWYKEHGKIMSCQALLFWRKVAKNMSGFSRSDEFHKFHKS